MIEVVPVIRVVSVMGRCCGQPRDTTRLEDHPSEDQEPPQFEDGAEDENYEPDDLQGLHASSPFINACTHVRTRLLQMGKDFKRGDKQPCGHSKGEHQEVDYDFHLLSGAL